MAQTRGRKPKGNYKLKTQVLSTRIRADTKAALEAAAQERGHSLSQEIEYRLRRSFDEDQGIFEKFGGRRNYAVVRLVSSLMGAVYNPINPEVDWLDDPYQFDQLVKMVNHVLEELRPVGDPELAADETERAFGALQSGQVAAYTLLAVRDASPEVPLDPKSIAPLIRSDLGAAADRIGRQPGRRIVMGNADDFRRAAEAMKQEDGGDDR